MCNYPKQSLLSKLSAIVFFLSVCATTTAFAQRDTSELKVTLPAAGKMINGKPAGKGWVNLLDTTALNLEKQYWQLNNGILHGDCNNQNQHHYSYTKKVYTDFELNVMIKMTGDEANSGVCIRIHPTDFDNAPGYQVDMGKGYWGSLWEERRASMVQKYPEELSAKLVKAGDWNHYYIIAKGHHIEAWLNGVKTIDIIHAGGFLDGNIGIQLCHGQKHTIVDVKAMYVRELK
ncbi:DUF1080 domain-containing protein [Mucilaginibacter sp.]|uniref:3-keto-disaccharide hydrolase n=1 Tax=Mucilaginibacter sp. TaxID=1882438 RepID=UPI003262E895